MNIAVIGAGASGLMAAIGAAEGGAERVWLFEKNALPGRKILLTGNGRCNVTNTAEVRSYAEHFFDGGKFLYKPLHVFSPLDLMDFFASRGVRLKEEDGGRVFPASDKAQDILRVLFARCEELGVAFHENEPVVDIRRDLSGHISKVVTRKSTYDADACVLCTGGSSYPSAGSTGDGYMLAGRLGHTIVPVRPGLVPVDTDSAAAAALQGVSLRAVRARAFSGREELAGADGDLLFSHVGLTGPAIFRISRYLPTDPKLYEAGRVYISVDLLPRLNPESAREEVMALLAQNQNRRLSHVLRKFGPESFLSYLMQLAGIPEDIYCRDLKKDLRERLTALLKNVSFTVKKAPAFSRAMVTAGGVDLKEVDPRTMQSKLVPGLFLAGEVLNIDGDTGGFNLQAAFSTGYTAGISAAEGSRSGPPVTK